MSDPAEAPKPEAPAAEAPAAEVPAAEAEAPKAEAPKAEEPKTEAPKEAVEPQQPVKEVAKAEAPATKASAVSETPLQQLWAAAQAHSHNEVWGVTLADPATHVPSQIVLQKYLNANDGDVSKAKDQLTKTLDWRDKMKPLDLLEQDFNATKFQGLGYVTNYGGGDAETDKEVFTWNIYGSVKSIDETFGNLDE